VSDRATQAGSLSQLRSCAAIRGAPGVLDSEKVLAYSAPSLRRGAASRRKHTQRSLDLGSLRAQRVRSSGSGLWCSHAPMLICSVQANGHSRGAEKQAPAPRRVLLEYVAGHRCQGARRRHGMGLDDPGDCTRIDILSSLQVAVVTTQVATEDAGSVVGALVSVDSRKAFLTLRPSPGSRRQIPVQRPGQIPGT